MAALGIGYLVSRGAASAVAVGTFVDLSEIRFGFDDHTGNPIPVFIRHHEQFAKQVA